MVPLYAARIQDLRPGDLIRVECLACGHDEMIPPSGLLVGLRPPPSTLTVELGSRFPVASVCESGGGGVGSVGRLNHHWTVGGTARISVISEEKFEDDFTSRT